MELGEVVVSATGIEKYFGDNHVLQGVNLEVRQHETVMLIGRSGSGKTTMLRCLNFLEEPTMGTVRIGDITVEADPLHSRSRGHREQIRQLRVRAGMVFQDFNLFPHMTVLQNCIEGPTRVKGVAAGRRPSRRPSATWTRSSCSTGATSTRPGCRAARSSVSPSRGRCPWSPRCSCSTSRPPPSTRSSWARCCR